MGLINKKAMQKIIEDSPLCKHAIRELKKAGYMPDEDDPNGWMYNQVMESVAVFSSHGHSGLSAPCEINLVKKLCNWEVLTPLTFNYDEWMKISEDGTMQNMRKGSIFKDPKGRIYDIDAYTCKPFSTYRYDEKKEVPNEAWGCYSGTVFEMEDGKFTGRCFNTIYIAKKTDYTPNETVKIPVLEIEYEKNEWLFAAIWLDIAVLYGYEYYNIGWLDCETLKGIGVYDIDGNIVDKAYKELESKKIK